MSLEVVNNVVTINIDGTIITETVSWAGIECYFKAGSYPQHGVAANYPVDYHFLSYTGAYDGTV